MRGKFIHHYDNSWFQQENILIIHHSWNIKFESVGMLIKFIPRIKVFLYPLIVLYLSTFFHTNRILNIDLQLPKGWCSMNPIIRILPFWNVVLQYLLYGEILSCKEVSNLLNVRAYDNRIIGQHYPSLILYCFKLTKLNTCLSERTPLLCIFPSINISNGLSFWKVIAVYKINKMLALKTL